MQQHLHTHTHTYTHCNGMLRCFFFLVLTFSVELQGAQQAHRFEHLSDVHLQTALQLDEEPADLRVDLPILWPEMSHSRKLFCYLERQKTMRELWLHTCV